MATRRKSPPRRNGSSPFGYVIFGIVAGLGIAAAAAYYLRANSQKAAPSTPVITQQQKLTPPAPRPEPTPIVTPSPEQPPVVAQTPPTTPTTPAMPAAPVETTTVEPPPPSIAQQVGQTTHPPVESVSPAAPAIAAQQPPKQQSSQPPKSEQKPDTKEPKKDAPKQVASKPSTKSDDQIGHLINTMNNPKKAEPKAQVVAKAAPTPEKSTSNTSGGQYLQVGSFKSSSEADAKRAQLLMQGFSNITITKAKVNDTEFNRVRIGPFSSDASLKEAQERLKSQNINATVIR